MRVSSKKFKKIQLKPLVAALATATVGFVAAGHAVAAGMPGAGAVVYNSTGTAVGGTDAVGSFTLTVDPVTGGITGLETGDSLDLTSTGANQGVVIVWGHNSTLNGEALSGTGNAPGFNIASGNTLAIADSALNNTFVLNVDASGNTSVIDGTITGTNVNLFFANQNGITVGPNAIINAPAALGFIGGQVDGITSTTNAVGFTPAGNVTLNGTGDISIDGGAAINTAGTGQKVLIMGDNTVNINMSATTFAGGDDSQIIAGFEGNGVIDYTSVTDLVSEANLTASTHLADVTLTNASGVGIVLDTDPDILAVQVNGDLALDNSGLTGAGNEFALSDTTTNILEWRNGDLTLQNGDFLVGAADGVLGSDNDTAADNLITLDQVGGLIVANDAKVDFGASGVVVDRVNGFSWEGNIVYLDTADVVINAYQTGAESVDNAATGLKNLGDVTFATGLVGMDGFGAGAANKVGSEDDIVISAGRDITVEAGVTLIVDTDQSGVGDISFIGYEGDGQGTITNSGILTSGYTAGASDADVLVGTNDFVGFVNDGGKIDVIRDFTGNFDNTAAGGFQNINGGTINVDDDLRLEDLNGQLVQTGGQITAGDDITIQATAGTGGADIQGNFKLTGTTGDNTQNRIAITSFGDDTNGFNFTSGTIENADAGASTTLTADGTGSDFVGGAAGVILANGDVDIVADDALTTAGSYTSSTGYVNLTAGEDGVGTGAIVNNATITANADSNWEGDGVSNYGTVVMPTGSLYIDNTNAAAGDFVNEGTFNIQDGDFEATSAVNLINGASSAASILADDITLEGSGDFENGDGGTGIISAADGDVYIKAVNVANGDAITDVIQASGNIDMEGDGTGTVANQGTMSANGGDIDFGTDEFAGFSNTGSAQMTASNSILGDFAAGAGDFDNTGNAVLKATGGEINLVGFGGVLNHTSTSTIEGSTGVTLSADGAGQSTVAGIASSAGAISVTAGGNLDITGANTAAAASDYTGAGVDITNTGSVSVSAGTLEFYANGVAFTAAGDAKAADDLTVYDANGVDNSATLQGTAVYFTGDSIGNAGAFVNTGTINATAGAISIDDTSSNASEFTSFDNDGGILDADDGITFVGDNTTGSFQNHNSATIDAGVGAVNISRISSFTQENSSTLTGVGVSVVGNDSGDFLSENSSVIDAQGGDLTVTHFNTIDFDGTPLSGAVVTLQANNDLTVGDITASDSIDVTSGGLLTIDGDNQAVNSSTYTGTGITVTNTGKITVSAGDLDFDANGSDFQVAGPVSASGSIGVTNATDSADADADAVTIQNGGSLTAGDSVTFDGTVDGDFTVEAGGSIDGGNGAVVMNGTTGDFNSFYNAGTITGEGVTFFSDGGTFENRMNGTIDGTQDAGGVVSFTGLTGQMIHDSTNTIRGTSVILSTTGDDGLRSTIGSLEATTGHILVNADNNDDGTSPLTLNGTHTAETASTYTGFGIINNAQITVNQAGLFFDANGADFVNNGSAVAANTAELDISDVANVTNNAGAKLQGGDVDINGNGTGSLVNAGEIRGMQADSVTIDGMINVTNKATGTINSAGSLSITGTNADDHGTFANYGVVQSAGAMPMAITNFETFVNGTGATIQSDGDTTFTGFCAGDFTNSGAITVGNGGINFAITKFNSFTNNTGATVTMTNAASQLTITGCNDTCTADDGKFTNNGTISLPQVDTADISISQFSYGNFGTLNGGDVDIRLIGDLINANTIHSEANLSIYVSGNIINEKSGVISVGAGKDLMLVSDGTACGTADETTYFINNNEIQAGKDLTIVVGDYLLNTSSLEAVGDLTLTSWNGGTFTNTGDIVANRESPNDNAGMVDINGVEDSFTNSGTIRGANIDVDVYDATSSSATFLNDGAIYTNADDFSLVEANIRVGTQTAGVFTDVTNNGTILGENVTIYGTGAFVNGDGTGTDYIRALGDTTSDNGDVILGNTFTNFDNMAEISGANDVTVNMSGTFTNTGSVMADHDMTVVTAPVANCVGNLSINSVSGAFLNDGTGTLGGVDITITSVGYNPLTVPDERATFTNTEDATLAATRNLTIGTAGDPDNTFTNFINDGVLSANHDLNVHLGGERQVQGGVESTFMNTGEMLSAQGMCDTVEPATGLLRVDGVGHSFSNTGTMQGGRIELASVAIPYDATFSNEGTIVADMPLADDADFNNNDVCIGCKDDLGFSSFDNMGEIRAYDKVAVRGNGYGAFTNYGSIIADQDINGDGQLYIIQHNGVFDNKAGALLEGNDVELLSANAPQIASFLNDGAIVAHDDMRIGTPDGNDHKDAATSTHFSTFTNNGSLTLTDKLYVNSYGDQWHTATSTVTGADEVYLDSDSGILDIDTEIATSGGDFEMIADRVNIHKNLTAGDDMLIETNGSADSFATTPGDFSIVVDAGVALTSMDNMTIGTAATIIDTGEGEEEVAAIRPNLFLDGTAMTGADSVFTFIGNNMIGGAGASITTNVFNFDVAGRYARLSAEGEAARSNGDYWGNWILLNPTGTDATVNLRSSGQGRQYFNFMVDGDIIFNTDPVDYTANPGVYPTPGAAGNDAPTNAFSQLMFQSTGNITYGGAYAADQRGANINDNRWYFPGLTYLANVAAVDTTGAIGTGQMIFATSLVNAVDQRISCCQGVYLMTDTEIGFTSNNVILDWYVLTNENSYVNFYSDAVRQQVLGLNENPIYVSEFDNSSVFTGFNPNTGLSEEGGVANIWGPTQLPRP